MIITNFSVSKVTAQHSEANPYDGMSDKGLAKAVDDNFQAFKDPATGNATTDKIREVAGRPLTGDAQGDKETQLAKEVLERDKVLGKLDSVDDNGKRDGIIGPGNPGMAANELSCNRCSAGHVFATTTITY